MGTTRSIPPGYFSEAVETAAARQRDELAALRYAERTARNARVALGSAFIVGLLVVLAMVLQARAADITFEVRSVSPDSSDLYVHHTGTRPVVSWMFVGGRAGLPTGWTREVSQPGWQTPVAEQSYACGFGPQRWNCGSSLVMGRTVYYVGPDVQAHQWTYDGPVQRMGSNVRSATVGDVTAPAVGGFWPAQCTLDNLETGTVAIVYAGPAPYCLTTDIPDRPSAWGQVKGMFR